MVLDYKRKRNKHRTALKQQFPSSEGSDIIDEDTEGDTLDMKEQLTAFNAMDMDSLEISSSQDYDGNEEHDVTTQMSPRMQSSQWEDVADVGQLQDGVYEYVDNTSYASQSASSTGACDMSVKDKDGCYRSFRLKQAMSTFEKRVVHGSLSADSEGVLSDSFDRAINLASAIELMVQPSNRCMKGSSTSPRVSSKAKWQQRLSIKRDCSLIDNSSNYSVSGRVLFTTTPPPTPVTTSESFSNGVIELKDGCFDSSDDAQNALTQHSEDFCSVLSCLPRTTAAVSSSFTDPSSSSIQFSPRLAKKQRKAGQLRLDDFQPTND